MDFNRRMASRIILDLEKSRDHLISLIELEAKLKNQLMALDKTFPVELKNCIENFVSDIEQLEIDEYAAKLNTSEEYRESVGRTNSSRTAIDQLIAMLKTFIQSS